MCRIVLSIIIPVYNTSKYLKRCLDSVLVNLDEHVEIIVVDDGSSDNSGVICDEYEKRHKQVKALHKENGGLSSARNAGLKVAQGEYVSFVDSDDMLAPCFWTDLKTWINYTWDILDYKCCYEKKENVFQLQGTKEAVTYSTREYLNLFIRNKFSNQICFRVYKRKLFENVRFPENRYYEDIATFYKLLKKAEKILCVDYEYYVYNITNLNSITKSVKKKCLEDMLMSADEMYEGLLPACKKFNLEKDYLLYNKINIYVYVAIKLLRCKEPTQNTKRKIRNFLKGKKIDFDKYRDYNIKKYIVYKILMLIRVL